jgi:hypothetical protein
MISPVQIERSPSFSLIPLETGALQDKAVTIIQEPSLVDWGWGGALFCLLGFSVYDFFVAACEYCAAETEEKANAACKKLLKQGVTVVGMGTYAADHLQSSKIFSLGEAASYIQGVGFVAWGIIGVLNAMDAIDKLWACDPESSDKAWHEQRIAVLNLAGAVMLVVWGVLGLGHVLAGAVLPVAATLGLMGVYAVCVLGAALYQYLLDRQYAEVEANA